MQPSKQETKEMEGIAGESLCAFQECEIIMDEDSSCCKKCSKSLAHEVLLCDAHLSHALHDGKLKCKLAVYLCTATRQSLD